MEDTGFEPVEVLPSFVFKTNAINQTLPIFHKGGSHPPTFILLIGILALKID
jgi:hypothetical protein